VYLSKTNLIRFLEDLQAVRLQHHHLLLHVHLKKEEEGRRKKEEGRRWNLVEKK
jgi:hypothetical protein